MADRMRTRLTGGAALVAAVVLWSSFALTVRGIGSSSLTSIDVAFLRFATPVVILAPWLPRTVRALRGERIGVLLLLGVGGLPHFLLSALGGRLTSAALIGLLVPGTVPLFVTVILYLRWRERISSRRLIALAAITTGIAATAIQTTSTSTTAGVGILLTAGCAWAVYTIGLRQTGLGPAGVVLTVCTPAAIAAAPARRLRRDALASDDRHRRHLRRSALHRPSGHRDGTALDRVLRLRGAGPGQHPRRNGRRDQPRPGRPPRSPPLRRAHHLWRERCPRAHRHGRDGLQHRPAPS